MAKHKQIIIFVIHMVNILFIHILYVGVRPCISIKFIFRILIAVNGLEDVYTTKYVGDFQFAAKVYICV